MSALVYRVALIALFGVIALAPPAVAGGTLTAGNATMAPAAYDTDFHPVCAEGSFYACRFEPFGSRFCGCWLGGDRPACPVGYFFACGREPNGARACGCY